MASKVTTEKVGNALGFAGLILFPILFGFGIWMSSRVKNRVVAVKRGKY